MITFKEYLTEALNSPYDWKWVKQGAYSAEAVFIDKNEEEFHVYFKSDWEATTWDVVFRWRKGFGNTGFYDPYSVLSTVTDIVFDFIDKNRPDRFTFYGNKEDKHAKLYKAMVKYLSKKIKARGYVGGPTKDNPDRQDQDFIFIRK